MVTCVDILYVEENGVRRNICEANADEILTTCRTNYGTIMTAPNLIVELRTELEPILEVTIFLDQDPRLSLMSCDSFATDPSMARHG